MLNSHIAWTVVWVFEDAVFENENQKKGHGAPPCDRQPMCANGTAQLHLLKIITLINSVNYKETTSTNHKEFLYVLNVSL